MGDILEQNNSMSHQLSAIDSVQTAHVSLTGLKTALITVG